MVKQNPQLIHETHTRHLDFYDPLVFDPRITIVGAGGIGSPVVWLLAKLGVRRITVFDDDKVKRHNLPTTMYSPKDLGKFKVDALKRLVIPFGCTLRAIPSRFTEKTRLPKTDILISAVDGGNAKRPSFDGRRLLFKVAQERKIPFFIDGRIGGEVIRVYTLQPSKSADRKFYRTTFVPDHRIKQLPCNAQQVCDVGSMIASFVVRAVRKWVVEGSYNQEIMHHQSSLTAFVSERKLCDTLPHIDSVLEFSDHPVSAWSSGVPLQSYTLVVPSKEEIAPPQQVPLVLDGGVEEQRG